MDHDIATKYLPQPSAENKGRQESEREQDKTERSTIEVMSHVLRDKARRDDEMTRVRERERGRASGVKINGCERMTRETERV